MPIPLGVTLYTSAEADACVSVHSNRDMSVYIFFAGEHTRPFKLYYGLLELLLLNYFL